MIRMFHCCFVAHNEAKVSSFFLLRGKLEKKLKLGNRPTNRTMPLRPERSGRLGRPSHSAAHRPIHFFYWFFMESQEQNQCKKKMLYHSLGIKMQINISSSFFAEASLKVRNNQFDISQSSRHWNAIKYFFQFFLHKKYSVKTFYCSHCDKHFCLFWQKLMGFQVNSAFWPCTSTRPSTIFQV